MNQHAFRHVIAAASVLMTVLLVSEVQTARAEKNTPSGDQKYLLKEEPKAAAEVSAVRKGAKDGDDVMVVGRIGGRKNPWIKGAAAFSIVDRSLTPCNEMEGDTCPTPWDYCCEADLAKATLLVMVHDERGKLVAKDARQLLGVKELDTVVIRGKAKRDKAGNVSVIASKLYVAPVKKETRQ